MIVRLPSSNLPPPSAVKQSVPASLCHASAQALTRELGRSTQTRVRPPCRQQAHLSRIVQIRCVSLHNVRVPTNKVTAQQRRRFSRDPRSCTVSRRLPDSSTRRRLPSHGVLLISSSSGSSSRGEARRNTTRMREKHSRTDSHESTDTHGRQTATARAWPRPIC